MQKRDVYLTGSINQITANALTEQFQKLDRENSEPITLHIDSPGGQVWAADTIIDTMMTLRSPVHTIAEGMAAGAALDVLAHGDIGHRSARENAQLTFVLPARMTADPQRASERAYPQGIVDRVVKLGM